MSNTDEARDTIHSALDTESARAFKALFGIMGVSLIGVLLYAMQGSTFISALARMGVGVTAAAASMVVGGMLGFLFGIPRTLQRERPAQSGPDAARQSDTDIDYRANTNLEQISDWLTKILVGVGLTQLSKLPEKLQSLAAYLGKGLGSEPSAPVFIGLLLVVFNLSGFLLSYLWTRLYLPRELRQADINTLALKVANLEQQVDKDARALNYAQRQLNPSTDHPRVSEKQLTAALMSASPSARAVIFSEAQKFRQDNWRERSSEINCLIPIFQALIATDPKGEYHRYRGQLGYALKDQSPPNWKDATAALSEAIRLRGGPQEGWVLYEFNRALCNISLSADTGGAPTDPTLKASILADLKVAVQGGMDRVVFSENEKAIAGWMKEQNVQRTDIAS